VVAQYPLIPRRPARRSHDVQDMAPDAAVGADEEQPVGHAVVMRMETRTRQGAFVAPHRSRILDGRHQVDDRLGSQAGHGRRTDVLDRREQPRHGGLERLDRGGGLARPVGVVVEDANRSGRGHEPHYLRGELRDEPLTVPAP
jgi:hypothetical protein